MARFKKKTKKKKKDNLPPISVEEQELLESLLTNLSQIDRKLIREHITSPTLAVHFLERLPAVAPEGVDLVPAIWDAFEQKEVRKSVKRAAFRLKREGIAFPEAEARKGAPAVMEAPKVSDPEAHVGPIDGTGTRGILIVLPRLPTGVDMGVGLISSEKGIIQFLYGRNSKKRSREIKGYFHGEVKRSIETSMSHAATLLEKAYQKDPALREDARDYLKLRPWILENFSLHERPVIYDYIPAEEMSGEMLTGSRIKKLLDHELMLSWIISPDEIQPLMEEMSGAEESPIIMSDEQRIERLNEIKEKAVAKLYPESKRRQMKEDLEEMAYLFFKLDEEEYARNCMLAVRDVDEKESVFKVDSFLRGYLEHSLEYYYRTISESSGRKGREDDSSSMIITP